MMKMNKNKKTKIKMNMARKIMYQKYNYKKLISVKQKHNKNIESTKEDFIERCRLEKKTMLKKLGIKDNRDTNLLKKTSQFSKVTIMIRYIKSVISLSMSKLIILSQNHMALWTYQSSNYSKKCIRVQFWKVYLFLIMKMFLESLWQNTKNSQIKALPLLLSLVK